MDRTRLLAALLFTAPLGACSSGPQLPPDSAYARPPLHDDFLDHLVGTWHISRSARGKILENEMDARWTLQHQFIVMHMLDPHSPPAYEATVHIGFDPAKARYVAHWCDSFGGGFSAIGYGTRNGDSIEFKFNYDDGPFFNTFTWRPEDQSWSFKGENGQTDGSRTLFMQDRATRR